MSRQESIGVVVHNIPSKVSLAISEPLDKCCAGIDKLVSELKRQLSEFIESVNCSVSKVSQANRPNVAAASLLKDHATTTVASNRSTHCKYDRANNVVLFGLPETSLMETKTAIDNLSMHLIGKSIKLVDAFHFGRNSESTSTCPCPLLI